MLSKTEKIVLGIGGVSLLSILGYFMLRGKAQLEYFKCPICGRSFDTLDELNTHIASAHPSTGIPDGKFQVQLVNFPLHKIPVPSGTNPNWNITNAQFMFATQYGGWLVFPEGTINEVGHFEYPSYMKNGFDGIIITWNYNEVMDELSYWHWSTEGWIRINYQDYLSGYDQTIVREFVISPPFEPQNRARYIMDAQTGLWLS